MKTVLKRLQFCKHASQFAHMTAFSPQKNFFIQARNMNISFLISNSMKRSFFLSILHIWMLFAETKSTLKLFCNELMQKKYFLPRKLFQPSEQLRTRKSFKLHGKVQFTPEEKSWSGSLFCPKPLKWKENSSEYSQNTIKSSEDASTTTTI